LKRPTSDDGGEMKEQRDRWAEWLLERRFGSEAAGADEREQVMGRLRTVRDRVLDHANLESEETLLDVGSGDGLIGFGALARGAATVIFSDISQDLLNTCHGVAQDLDLLERSRFLRAGADDLSGLDDASVDIVTTRSVLIYVEHKRQAFAEFVRVLRAGGRISLYEPINRFAVNDGWERDFWIYPADGLTHLAEKLNSVYAAIQPPTDPMINFDERDLIDLAEQAGFFPIELELQAEIRRAEAKAWQVFLHSSGNPKIPTFDEAMRKALTPAERDRVVAHLRPLVEGGHGIWRMAHAYLWATKPGAQA
jgi:ubiquinone/menaquinone biosynthesis C-methylase UbiE